MVSLFAGATVLGPQAPATAPAPGQPPLSIGVVDFARVLAAYPRAIEIRKSMDDWRKQQIAMIDAEERKLAEIKLKRDDLQPDTAERDSRELEMRLKMNFIEGQRQVLDREWGRKVEGYYAAMYDDMQQAVAILAKDRGLQLVLRTHPDPDDLTSSRDKSRVFEARMVWYAADEIDVTPALIKLLQVPLPTKPAGETDPPQDPKKQATGG
jgi:Skp family chaperone for outer membrane proteins